MKRILNGKEVDMTNEEIAALEESRKRAWDKQAYCEEVWRAHSEWYRILISRKPDFDYESKGEVEFYTNHKDDAVRNQAISLRDLWFTSVDLLYAHCDEVTEETANVEAFIQSLPNL